MSLLSGKQGVEHDDWAQTQAGKTPPLMRVDAGIGWDQTSVLFPKAVSSTNCLIASNLLKLYTLFKNSGIHTSFPANRLCSVTIFHWGLTTKPKWNYIPRNDRY